MMTVSNLFPPGRGDGAGARAKPNPSPTGTGTFGPGGKTLLLAACGLLFSGCTALGPDFQTPKAQIEQDWVEARHDQLKQEEGDYSQWWKSFNDPVLDQLIGKAYAQNLTLQEAGLRILGARANLGIAIGQQFPQQQEVGAQVSNVGLSKHAPNGANANRHFMNYQGGLNAAWELDFWGKYRRGVESAEATLRATEADYDNALVSLTAEVASTYISLRTLDERLAIARNNVKTQKRSYQITNVRYQDGAVSGLDPAQALSLLRDTESTIPTLEAQRKSTAYALSVLLGLPPNDLQDIIGAPGVIPTPPAEVAVGIPADLLRRRPDIRIAELNAAAQSANVGVATTLLYPSFSLFGSLGLQTSSNGGVQSRDSDFSDLFSSNSVFYGIGPGVNWPILNYGRLKNNVRVQDAALQQLLVSYRNTVLQAAREVEDASAGFLGSQASAELLSQGVKSAKRAVYLAGIQYRDGAVDYTRVLNTEDFLLQEEDRLTTSRGDIAQSLVSLYRALGGGWQIRQGNDYVPEDIQQQMRARTDWGDLMPVKGTPDELPASPASGKAQPLFNRPQW